VDTKAFSVILRNMKIKTLLILVLFVNLASAQNTDIDLLRKINVNRNVKLDPAFKFVSNSVTPIMLAAPLSVLTIGLIQKDKTTIQRGMVMGGTLLLNGAITTGLKFAVKRPRPFVTYPDIVKLDKAGSYSFPSGHTSSAFAAATSLCLAYPKWYVIAPSFVWAGLAGYSRMHLGVHYPSDVLVGALIGIGSGILMHCIGKRYLSGYPGY